MIFFSVFLTQFWKYMSPRYKLLYIFWKCVCKSGTRLKCTDVHKIESLAISRLSPISKFSESLEVKSGSSATILLQHIAAPF